MSLTSKVLPSLQPIKSLPPGFKVNGNMAPDRMENQGGAKLRSANVVGSGSPENGAMIGEVYEDARDRAGDVGLFDDDLAYSGKGVLEDRPAIADEDFKSVPLPFQSVSVSSREWRWSDTTPYASKKVLMVSDFISILCCPYFYMIFTIKLRIFRVRLTLN